MIKLGSNKISKLFLAVVFIAAISFSASAQKKKSSAHTEPQKPVVISEANPNSSTSSEDKTSASAKSSNVYVQSLQEQLAIREREVKSSKDSLEKTKQLFADGILSKREVEQAEVALVEAQTKADDIRRKLAVYQGTTPESTEAKNETEQKTDVTEVEKAIIKTPEKESKVKRTVQTRTKVPVKKTQKTKRP